ncbi:MAG: adenosine kinase [Cirrosporium novae-zelandiae]|nr:MAG: adenosine kinase [Cirrosporium novae-zelandiae]
MDDNKSYSLLCLENPLLDIQASCDASVLEKYGLKANDAILAEDKHMSLYDDLQALQPPPVLLAGGAAQNSARGAQYLLSPSSVLYIGCVGADKSAELLAKACADAGVAVEYLTDPKEPTGRCGVVITGNNRSLVTHLAAANNYKVDHLKSPKIWALVEKAQVYYVGGFHLTVCPDAILALAQEAAEKNKIFVLNLSAPFISQFFKDPLDKTLEYVDYLIGNETEAAAYAESHGWNTTDVKEIAKKLAALPKKNTKRERTVIITQGTEETVVAINGEIKEYPILKIDKKDICDTNGAGDAFAGGLLAGIVDKKPLQTAIDMGQWLARLSIKELGPS